MVLDTFFTNKPEGLVINLEVAPVWKTNSIGTSFMLVELTDGETVGIHEDSIQQCKEDCDETGRLSNGWAVSKSKILFKKEKRTASSPWQF